MAASAQQTRNTTLRKHCRDQMQSLTPNTLDELFCSAVSAIDAGDVIELERLVTAHPTLVRDRLEAPGAWLRGKVGDALDGFFQKPYLLWFVAEDPVRNGTLPANIADITRAVIRAAEREGVETLQEQLDYALRLVSWSWIARDCNVQIDLVDVLIDAGASPDGNPDNALVNGNFAAAAHLVERGARLTLATALCLGRWDDVRQLGATASAGTSSSRSSLRRSKARLRRWPRVITSGRRPECPLRRSLFACHASSSRGVLGLTRGGHRVGGGRRRPGHERHRLRRHPARLGRVRKACRDRQLPSRQTTQIRLTR